MREIVVELHAQAGDLAGAREARVTVRPDATCGELKHLLGRRFPALAGLIPASAVANDEEYLADAAALGGTRRFHLIPPVSGG